MPQVQINVLGGVDVLRDGERTRPRRQVGVTLAILVAAQGRPVPALTIAESVQRDEARGPKFDPLPRIVSELRDLLAGADLEIPPDKERRGYQLVPKPGASLDDLIDAYRFQALNRAASDRYAEGDEAAALESLDRAAAEWAGAPFDTGWQGQLPDSCARFAATLERTRRSLLRQVAEIALRRGGRYEAAAVFRDRPIGEDAARVGAVWLATLLTTTLRDKRGVREAERIIAASDPGDVVRRARDLVALCRAGVRVHEPLAGPQHQPANGSPAEIVGRDEELADLADMLNAVRAGRPAAMVVRGASGLGKTRLAEEFAAVVSARDVPVVAVTRRARGQSQPWQFLAGRLWANCLRDIGAGPDPLTPEQHEILLGFIRGSRAEQPGRDEDPARQFAELAHALSRLARQAAERRGLIVVFDDADQMAERGRELLRDVRASLSGAGIGWIVLGRDGGTWTELPGLDGDEARSERVLTPLPLADVQRWVGQVRGHGDDQEATSVFRRTGGVPLSLCDELTRDTRPPAAPGHDDDLLEWAAAAAVTATDLDIDTGLVRRMLELTDAEADRREAGAARPYGIDTSAGVRFTHVKYLSRVLKRLDEHPAMRRDLHHRAFEVLSERVRAAEDANPGLPVRVAEHARGADRDVAPPEAARAYLAAARTEMAGYDSEAAASWARAGLKQAPASDPATRFGLHLVLGDALEDQGLISEADEQYLLAYDTARGRPREQAKAAISMARRWTDPGRVDNHLLTILRASLDGLAGAEGGQDAEATALRLCLTAHLAHKSSLAVPALSDPPEDGVALADAALSQFIPDLGPDVACEVLDECRWAKYDHEPPASTIVLARRLEQASVLARSPYFQSEALMALAIDQLRLGQIAEARGTIEQHRQSFADNRRGEWLQGALDTLIDMWDGDFGRAEQRLFGEAMNAVGQAQAEHARWAGTLLQTWQGQVYWVMRERGRIGELIGSEMAEEIGRHGHFPIWRAAIILARCDVGDLDRAAAELAALARETGDFAAFPRSGWATSLVALLAECCLALSPVGPDGPAPHPLSGRVRELLDQWPGEFALAGWPVALLGPVGRFSGLLATASGDYAGAIRLFDDALLAVGAARPQVARLRLDKARALVRAGDAQAAAPLLAQVEEEASRLGMAPVAGEAHRLARLPRPPSAL